MSSSPTVGLFVPLYAKSDKNDDVKNFLLAGHGMLEAEPLTLQWYAIRHASEPHVFAIFDTFAADNGRTAHLNGKIAEALGQNASALLAKGPEIGHVNVLASKIQKGNVKLGLHVQAEARPEKVEAVKEFLISALPLVNEETLTPQWYAIHLTGTNTFAILDFNETEEGRQAHLDGQVAAALFAKADEFFVRKPDVMKVDVVAHRVL
ncbi:hypothetical protein BD410DRAFT_787359 [Rickenella mellea]|uniref:ABM domain-containing protein n=1 Tax=Rickenella mellea TaxID=50990 RepID=A0A4Y7Q7F7_9AGAM|nr:hypothetical protein BD410DRAFT_787359 [Rickenella mellea]